MGQSVSHKFTRNKKSLVFPKKHPEYMEPYRDLRIPNSEGQRQGLAFSGESKGVSSSGKSSAVCSKGVAISFGFKKRSKTESTSGTSSNKPISSAASNSKNNRDKKGQIEDKVNLQKTAQKPENTQRSDETRIKPYKFGFRQKRSEPTHKTQSIKSPSSASSGFGFNRTSPSGQCVASDSLNKCTHINETNRTNNVVNHLPRRIVQPQVGKYTLQSTELPQLEPVRVIESKSEKTIINTQRKTASIRQQHEKTVSRDERIVRDIVECSDITRDTVKNTNDLHYKQTHNISVKRSSENNNFLAQKSDSNRSNEQQSSHLSPGLNNNSNNGNQKSTTRASPHDLGSFYEADIQKTFFKLRLDEMAKTDDYESNLWDNAGEAMALDITNLGFRYNKTSKEKHNIITNGNSSRLQTSSPINTMPFNSLDLLQSLKSPVSMINEDLSFTAVAAASDIGALLDDQILSPVESLSSSENDAITKNSSKEINEKSTSSSPVSPTNASSIFLAEEKDFLIDDEIADQPELIFKNTPTKLNKSISSNNYNFEEISRIEVPICNQRKSLTSGTTPLSSKNKKILTKSNGSLDSLSSCESIASDDFIVDYDSSHTNEIHDHHSSSSRISEKNRPISKIENFQERSCWIDKDTCYPPLFTNGISSHGSLNSLGYNDTDYDLNYDNKRMIRTSPTVLQDVSEIKKMLLKLRMVLNDSQYDISFTHALRSHSPHLISLPDRRSIENIYHNDMVEKELDDLRRQVLFLQLQLENKEEIVNNLQKQMTDMRGQTNITNDVQDIPVVSNLQRKCNAATQTQRII